MSDVARHSTRLSQRQAVRSNPDPPSREVTPGAAVSRVTHPVKVRGRGLTGRGGRDERRRRNSGPRLPGVQPPAPLPTRRRRLVATLVCSSSIYHRLKAATHTCNSTRSPVPALSRTCGTIVQRLTVHLERRCQSTWERR